MLTKSHNDPFALLAASPIHANHVSELILVQNKSKIVQKWVQVRFRIHFSSSIPANKLRCPFVLPAEAQKLASLQFAIRKRQGGIRLQSFYRLGILVLQITSASKVPKLVSFVLPNVT